jgi:hypothetical protein
MAGITTKVLDAMQCEAPGCSHEDHEFLFVHPRCHPRQRSVQVRYSLTGKCLDLYCPVCDKFIVSISVTQEEQDVSDTKEHGGR